MSFLVGAGGKEQGIGCPSRSPVPESQSPEPVYDDRAGFESVEEAAERPGKGVEGGNLPAAEKFGFLETVKLDLANH